jgi:hypothetical protein
MPVKDDSLRRSSIDVDSAKAGQGAAFGICVTGDICLSEGLETLQIPCGGI